MIEAFWRSLKHQWLYLNPLDLVEHGRTLVAFYVEQHNTQMPHAAFSGQTPDELLPNSMWIPCVDNVDGLSTPTDKAFPRVHG